jgi:hypothetical protein
MAKANRAMPRNTELLQAKSALAADHGGGFDKRFPYTDGAELQARNGQVEIVTMQSKEAQARAEAAFKRKELQAREASKAMAEYQAARLAEREKTARLRLLREAKAAADAAAARSEEAKTTTKAKVDRKKPTRQRPVREATNLS